MNIEDKSRNGVIDCTINPRIPKGLDLLSHHSNLGKIRWDPSKVRLLKLDPLAKDSYESVSLKDEMEAALTNNPTLIPEMWKDGKELLVNVKNRAFKEGGIPLPANVLDDLLENPKNIPLEWDDKMIIFIGSLYKGYDDGNDYSNLMARSLLKNPIHSTKEAIQKIENPLARAVCYGAYYTVYPLLLSVTGSSDFVEHRFQFDDSLRYLTREYVPIYLR